jgi:hypothetical protein
MVRKNWEARKSGRAEEWRKEEKACGSLFLFGILNLWILNLFRISCFEFRIYFRVFSIFRGSCFSPLYQNDTVGNSFV